MAHQSRAIPGELLGIKQKQVPAKREECCLYTSFSTAPQKTQSISSAVLPTTGLLFEKFTSGTGRWGSGDVITGAASVPNRGPASLCSVDLKVMNSHYILLCMEVLCEKNNRFGHDCEMFNK